MNTSFARYIVVYVGALFFKVRTKGSMFSQKNKAPKCC